MRLTLPQKGILQLLLAHALRCAEDHGVEKEVGNKWLTTRPLCFGVLPAQLLFKHNIGYGYQQTIDSLDRRELISQRMSLTYLTIDGVEVARTL